MHVSGYMEFTPPKGVEAADFVRNAVDAMLVDRDLPAPFNLKPVNAPFVGARLPLLQEDHEIDLDYHVRRSALPSPGSQRELGVLVSRLHGNQLDFNRPLWELHVIEGLADGRFALFVKVHHCLIDGVSMMRHLTRSLSTDPDERSMAPFFAVPRQRSEQHEAPGSAGGPVDALRSAAWLARAGASALGDFGRSVSASLERQAGGRQPAVPYQTPNSALGGRVAGSRRFATQQYDLDQIKALAKAAGGTINDIVLYLSSTALRRYLGEVATVPDRPLIGGLPVNLRAEGDERIGTSIGMMLIDLATDVADPQERLEAVIRSSTASKQRLRCQSAVANAAELMMVNGPSIVAGLTPLGGRVPVPFNVAISNVPGPTEHIYFNGARLDAFYPISLLSHGAALNITCLSYANTLSFGFVGARDSLEHFQHLAVHMGDALDEITAILLPDWPDS